MLLNTLKPNTGSKNTGRRLGRGYTRGKTCGRGHKGYKSRSGSSVPASFEGGQMPLQRRLPKNGFRYVHSQRNHTELAFYKLIPVINAQVSPELTIDIEFLVSNKLVPKNNISCKIFGTTETVLNKNIKKIVLGKSIRLTKWLTQHLPLEGEK